MKICLKDDWVRRRAFLGMLFAVLLLSSYAPACFAQSVGDGLLHRRVTLRVKEGTLLEALNRLADEESIPIGWEVSLNDFVRHDINVDLKKTSLKDVLDFLVLADPSYRWKLEDGVINFVPVLDRDQLLERLLNLRIKTFAPPKGLNRFAFRDAILDLPEVHNFLQSNELEASHTGLWSGPTPPLNVDFRMADIELRVVLNKVIRDSHCRVWTLSRTGENLQTLNLSF